MSTFFLKKMRHKNRKRQDKLPIIISNIEEKVGNKTKIEPTVKPIIQEKVGV